MHGFFEKVVRLWRWVFSDKKVPKRRQPRDDGPAANNSFRFRGAILDSLDRYFHYLAKMKDKDPYAYDLMGRVGLYVVPESALFSFETPYMLSHIRPSFGGVLFHLAGDAPDFSDGDKIHVKFVYFLKIENKALELQCKSAFYKVTMFYTDEAHPKGLAIPVAFHVAVSEMGQVMLLRDREFVSIKERRGHKRFEIPSMQYPWIIRTLARDHKQSPQQMAAGIFNYVANIQEDAALANARVIVRKGIDAALFNIDIKRTAYFFSDRDLVLNENGSKRRIFHIVRAHGRQIGNRTRNVRFHFRGMRKFDWNGYSINIAVPGLHHAPLETAQFAARENARTGLTMRQVGDKIAQVMQR